MRRFAILALLCVAISLPPGAALAAESAQPTWPNLLRTLVRFRALDLSDIGVLDEYAAVTECDLFDHFYRDDFKWNKVRLAVQDDVRKNIMSFPASYHYDTRLQLDRYDFQQRQFHFTERTVVRNVNIFTIFRADGQVCNGTRMHYVPKDFSAVLETPVYVTGLPLAQKDAQLLLARLTGGGNTQRIIQARFNLDIAYIEPLRRTFNQSTSQASYAQPGGGRNDAIRMDARLNSIEFFEDEEKTKPIYVYKP